MSSDNAPQAERTPVVRPGGWIRSEDWLAVFLGASVLALALAATWLNPASDFERCLADMAASRARVTELSQTPGDNAASAKALATEEKRLEELSASLFANPLKPLAAKIGSWDSNPVAAFEKSGKSILSGVFGVLVTTLVLFGVGVALRGESVVQFVPAFVVVFAAAVAAYVLAGQSVVKYYNLEYALWAIVLGAIVSNTIGTPRFLRPALRTELYIKTGLVLLGAEILLSRLLVLGLPGIFVSWVVTPIVLIGTYLFGQYVLRIESRSLNMVISADMSVCGVSAAIATAAACKAKKEELSLAIGISLSFTAIMMVAMPAAIRAAGMNQVLAGAWLGGTIDSTGAVAAAGGMLGPTALEVAATVKMIQNILIGVVAFGVAVYWVMYVERDPSTPRPGIGEIWKRFPRFILGFVGASIVFSAVYSTGPAGAALAETAIAGTSEPLRSWLFCLAFVSIGLETNFRELSAYLRGGKALTLYICGQSLNLALTLFMAWLMFEVVFPQTTAILSR